MDIATMRQSSRCLLAEDTAPPAGDALDTLAVLLRDHIGQLIPEVEAATLGLPKDDIPRACALACVGEARMRLRLGDGDTDAVRLAVAVKLARSVRALCDHYENLDGGRR
ncbi:DUF6415 family natural product biosynthesis protein [Streptomyces sp. NBC_01373]|uniref:DUF6415 family natural product biosynthesis protein n=1 Tax=Streptomyces sp. NBC_01373 TaxID=2903843 RepID=UPI002251156A|nr:DUF6415 family natural product biosynthesis protein [Streptomyces sp. NBC_01373]MCX4699536.1 DUF6415 family natural product biosynthesis protein [Streptomyces sp. NBC_01373]